MTDRKIPRDPTDNYGEAAVKARQEFIREHTESAAEHVAHYDLDPQTLPGNIENFFGVAQVPMGLAGPLVVNGEHAQGEFFVPLATTEGTLVASYNRGMKLCRAAGGITTTVIDDKMQRAPVFSFDNAREARAFGEWLSENFAQVKAAAETTTTSGKLEDIQQFPVSKLLYTRFNYSTGDAAGQNMTGKATFAACAWIKQNYPGTLHFLLEGQFATDKKTSVVNMLHTRGKRVVAEITLPAQLVEEQMHVSTDKLYAARMRGQLGSIMSVTNNNGNHSANGLTALFIATGQDVANIAESSALYGFSELLPNGDFYASITLPSLIIATYGGG
ncbi:MAG: hydroxymethylglutaryl-CoA reductase, partial [Marmoricola sp.]